MPVRDTLFEKISMKHGFRKLHFFPDFSPFVDFRSVADRLDNKMRMATALPAPKIKPQLSKEPPCPKML